MVTPFRVNEVWGEVMKVRVAGVVKESVVDGPGIRYAIFAQGCKHGCNNCHNPDTHNLNGGELMDADELISDILNNNHIDGVTFSGGDPFFQTEEFAYIGYKLKENGINILSYTGFKYEDIINDEKKFKLLQKLDILIDGRFVNDKKTLNLPFRGSSNQRIIDIKSSLITGKPIEIKL
jgi:anaerobic ribonucleoside-triphosphate reductase activating protein